MQSSRIDYSLPAEVIITLLPPMLTVKQAEGTGVASARMLRKMCADGEIRATKVGSDWRIARDPFFRKFGLVDYKSPSCNI